MTKRIQQLTPGVVKKLRSGIAFMSVAHCVEELVLNSIDAEANCIAVNLNLPVYQIQVIDNGYGISAEQMNIIGIRYATSKCHTVEDLQNLKSGGFRGEALSSLKEISSVLMIESRTAFSSDTYCKIFTQGKALDPKKSLNSRPSKGTTVTVYDFMYNLPVRKKSICEALDIEECRKLLQSIALMYPNVSFTLQNEATGEMCLQLRKCSSLYHSFFQMFGKSKADNLKVIDYQTDNYGISGCISTECYISKDLQFLYVNKRRVLSTKLHKLINKILNKALNSKQKSNIISSSSISESSSPMKNQCYCIFVINIKCPYDKYDIIFEPRKTMIEFSEWNSVLRVIEEALTDFLKRENLYSYVEESELDALNSEGNQNIVFPAFDVQDVQQGLFSHAARRLKLFKSDDNITSEKRSKQLEKNYCSEASMTESISKFCSESERTPSNDLRSSGTKKDIQSSIQLTSKNLISAKPNISLKDNLLGRLDQTTHKSVTSPLPKTDFDIPRRSVFPSENPVMLRIPSKSALSTLQTSSSNLKFLQMQEKIHSFVRKGNSNSLNQNEFERRHEKVVLHLDKTLSNKLQNSPVLCIDEKKYETKLKSMINKASQCPSVSNLNKIFYNTEGKNVPNDKFVAKETNDKSQQCPSVSNKNQGRVQSRFEFKNESHALLQNLQKFKRKEKNTSKKSYTTSDIVSCLVQDDEVHKSKKFKSSHCAENFEINVVSKVVEKRIPKNNYISVETSFSPEIYNDISPSYTSNDIESFPNSPTKVQNPDLYHKKDINFDKFTSLFDLQTFTKIKKFKHPAYNIPTFNKFGESFCFETEKLTQAEENIYLDAAKNEVSSYQDHFPDTTVSAIVHTSKEIGESYLEDSTLNSSFKENKGLFFTKKPSIDCGKSDENNTVDNTLNFSFNDLSPNSSDVSRVVHYLVSNVVDTNNLSDSPNIAFSKNNQIKETHQNTPHLSFQNEVIPHFDEVTGLHSNLMPNVSSKQLSSVHFEESIIAPTENLNLSFLNSKNSASSLLPDCNINFESDPFTQKCPTEPDNFVSPFKLNKSDKSSETSSLLNKRASNIFESDCFSEKLSVVPGNVNFSSTSQDNSYSRSNKNVSILEKRSTNDTELDSDSFPEKFSSILNNSIRLPYTKENNSDTETTIKDDEDLEFGSSIFTERLLSVPDYNSPTHSKTESSEILLDKSSVTLPDLEVKSTAEIEFESDALCKEISENCALKSSLEASEENINKTVPSTSSREIFTGFSSSELSKNPKVSVNECHILETSVVESSIKDNGSERTFTDNHKIDNLEITDENSTKNEFTMYNCLKLNSQPECKRKIHIDAITGNSSYIDSERSEIQQNKFIDANNGFLKKSHFFLTHDYSPFVHSTQTPNKFKIDNHNIQSDLMDYVKNNVIYGYYEKWRNYQEGFNCNENIEEMLKSWDNPTFNIPFEMSSIGDDKITQSISQMHFFLNSYRFSKITLNSLEVIGQVDYKFIACILKDFNENCRGQKLLALFDQHAVHERIRLEELIEDLYETDADDEKYVKTSAISPPLEISFSDEEIRLLQAYYEKLHKIGIHLKIDYNCHVLSVFSVPLCLVHKETGDLRRSVSDTATILQNSITEWLSSIVKTRSIPQVLPKTLSSVLNYQACRSAVKFGDPLNFEQCCDLMKSLSACKLPFQCAHGRPSIAPILDLKKIEALYKKKPPPQIQSLLRSFKNS